jgi:RNA polymerase sigma factor (sigma-70 family)
MLTNEIYTGHAMTNQIMTRDRLRQYTDLIAELESLRDTMAELEGRIYAPAIGQTDGMPRGGDAESSVERGALAHAALAEQLRELEDQISREALAIEKAIESLPSFERHIMRLHYIDGMTWERVAEIKHYSARHIRRIHEDILSSMVG